MVRSISRYHPRKKAMKMKAMLSDCTKKALIGDTTSRSHCVDVFIVRSIGWCGPLGNKQVITQVHSYDIFVINTRPRLHLGLV